MHNLSMALKNLKNNFSFYALYLLSVSFVITIFFAFTSFSMNAVMLEKISNDGRVETMCNTISVFLMAFAVFYMSYSNRFFLRRRMPASEEMPHRETPHTASKDHFPNRSLCDPVRDRVNTRTSSSMR